MDRPDFYARAEEGRRVIPAELAIVEAAVGAGPIAVRLVRQLHETGHVWRFRSDDGSFELRTSTIDPLRLRDAPRAGWCSEWIPVEDADTGRRLDVRISVAEGGIVGVLGRTIDGERWPRDWRLSEAVLERVRADVPWLHLSTPPEIVAGRAHAGEVIAAWLGDPGLLRGRRGALRADGPAANDAIVAFETREAFRAPEAYRSLVGVADGIEIGSIVVLGTSEAYRLDLPGPPRLVISPPTEDGALTLDEGGEVIWIDIDDRDAVGSVQAPDLRTWLIDRLRPGGPA